MPKKQPENHPSSLISHLVNHAKSTSCSPFPLEGLPGEAWKCLCLVAWKRLEQSNPRWGGIIENEFRHFTTTWLSNGFLCRHEYLGDKDTLSHHGGNVGDAWLVEAFQFMLNTKLKRGQKPLSSSYNLKVVLRDYDQLVFEVKALKKEFAKMRNKPDQAQERFWQEALQSILNQQPYRDETRTHAKVTKAMIRIARHESASAVAEEILYHLDGISPSTWRKKILGPLRKAPLSPTEFWQEKLLKSPR